MIKTVAAPPAERIILGIDPGTNVLGYGVLKVKGHSAEMMAMGVIDLRRCKDVYLKLGRIYERVGSVMDTFAPDEMAIEAPFFGKNVQSMLKLGRAQGVVMAAAMGREIPIHEYAPLKIKQAVTGNGMAEKEQVAIGVKRLLHLKDETLLPFFDATDALAAAYCHYVQTSGVHAPLGSLSSTKSCSHRKSTSWADFAKQNTTRISKRKS